MMIRGKTYWCIALDDPEWIWKMTWKDEAFDRLMMERGIAFERRDDAESAAKSIKNFLHSLSKKK